MEGAGGILEQGFKMRSSSCISLSEVGLHPNPNDAELFVLLEGKKEGKCHQLQKKRQISPALTIAHSKSVCLSFFLNKKRGRSLEEQMI